MTELMGSETRRRFGGMTVAVSAKVAPEERDMLDHLVALEREKGGDAAELTNAAFLRKLLLEAGEKAGVTPAQFREPTTRPQGPKAPAKPPYTGPSAEQVLAALERCVAGGVAVQRVVERTGIAHTRLSVFRSKKTIGNPRKNLPLIADALAKLGYPVVQPEA